MEGLSEFFGFERSVIPLETGLFRPLVDAIERWVEEIPETDIGYGQHFRILYELQDGRFVFLVYACCHARPVTRGNKRIELWSSDEPPQGGEIPAVNAVAFLLRGQQEIPPRLAGALAELQMLQNPPARELSFFRGKGQLIRRTTKPAHEVDVLAAGEQLLGLGISFVQAVRDWGPDQMWGTAVCVDHFSGLLFLEYAVDHRQWWGPQPVVLQGAVGGCAGEGRAQCPCHPDP